jgi:hypothetical protein
MDSPFPGVDPFLESQRFWPGFHVHFVALLCDALTLQLPDNYDVDIDESVTLVAIPPEQIKLIKPDLAVSKRGTSTRPPAPAGVATLEPVTLPLAIEEEIRQPFIEILHRPDRTLVAVLELLSPSNKDAPGRSSYLAKRHSQQPVHLIELDFLLGGQRLPLGKELPPGHFFAYVARADRRLECDVYPWSIRSSIPAIPVPLAHSDPDVWVDLAAVFKTAFRRGRYDRKIDYDRPLPASLNNEDQNWASEQIRTRAVS